MFWELQVQERILASLVTVLQSAYFRESHLYKIVPGRNIVSAFAEIFDTWMEDSDPDSDSDCPPEPKGKEDDVETSVIERVSTAGNRIRDDTPFRCSNLQFILLCSRCLKMCPRIFKSHSRDKW